MFISVSNPKTLGSSPSRDNNHSLVNGYATATVDVEIFHYPSLAKIIVRLLKFAGYVHYDKSLPGNIFGLILKKQDGCQRCFFNSNQRFLYNLWLGSIYRRLSLFMGDIINRYMCPV